jgi:hypothetical protein
MSSVDPQFESTVISLLKGIYDNIGSKPYDVISGFFIPVFDVNWDIELTEIINETGLSLIKGAISEGYIELYVNNAFVEGSPYSTTQIQVISSASMHSSNIVSCNILEDDPDFAVVYQSLNGPNNFTTDSRGLGYEKQTPFYFEIRLYKA